MKKLLTLLFILSITPSLLIGQQGLEKIIVEKYYVSNEADTVVNDDGGRLPVGSKSYRVFVDMRPDYIFQAAYGVPGHELRIATTTRFFNNEDRGEVFPSFGENRLNRNTVMLDSWLSVGGACGECVGVLKSMDDGLNTIVNRDDVLLNNDDCIDIPLTEQDGHILANPEPVTIVGISSDVEIFNSSNDSPMPTVLSTENGAWSSLNGSVGLDSMENIVLIGQFTTDGTFSFELNIQIRNELTQTVENYVARNPVNDELVESTLIYSDSMTTTSVNILNQHSDILKVFPNPAKSYLVAQFTQDIIGEGDLEIYSTSGQRVIYRKLNRGNLNESLTDINIKELSNGLYFLKIEVAGKTYTQKFLKS